MALILDLGTATGLAGASGVRPFLPPLLAGALASGDVAGFDFDGGDFAFLETPPFLLAVLLLTVVAYVVDRRGEGSSGTRPSAGRSPAEIGLAVVALGLGALLFAGALSGGEERSGFVGLPLGALCAALGLAAGAAFFGRARRRVTGGAAALLVAYADGVSLALAALSILVPPVGFLALVLLAVLFVRGRRAGERKYEGLRILR
jgi:hypothetical protein